jgi:hypothetical protein
LSVEDRLTRIEQALMNINEELGELKGKLDSENTLVKWVVFPLLVIVAALVGIKLVMPGG